MQLSILQTLFCTCCFKTELRIFNDELQHTSVARLVCKYTYKIRHYTDNKDLKLDISNMNSAISISILPKYFIHNVSETQRGEHLI